MSKNLIIMLLLGLLVSNPFILFLLTGSIVISGLILLISVISFFYISKIRNKKVVVYIVNIIVLFSLLIHFEVIFRFKFSDYIIENLYTVKKGFYLNKPFLLSYLSDKEYSSVYKTNCQGLRINESNDANEKIESCDWLFIGDSYTQGAQVNFGELYTSYLYKNFPDKVIVNSGISGLGIAEELELFKYWNSKLKPSKVFLQICNFNDFMNVVPDQNYFQSYLIEYSDLYRFFYYNLQYKKPDELPIGRWTEPFYNTTSENINYNIFYTDSNEKKERDKQKFRFYLEEFIKYTKLNNVELVIVQIPTKEQTYFKFFKEVIDSYSLDITKLDMFIPNRIVKDIADKHNVRYIDLYDSYTSSSGQVFFDFDEHLNSYGHYITAEAITNSLISWGVVSSSTLISDNFIGERYGNTNSGSNMIVYQALCDGNMEIFIKNIKSGETQRITTNNVDNLHPMLNSDGSKVIYTEGIIEDQQTNVIIHDLEKDSRITITEGKEEYGAIPVFSKNDKYIGYAAWERNGDIMTSPKIVIKELTSDSLYLIIDNGFENWRPYFSPDEKSIVYISKRNGNFDLYIYNIEDRSEIQLTNTPYDEWDPVFSANGEKILYAANKDSNWDLFSISLTNKKITQITSTLGDDWDPFYLSDDEIIYSGQYGMFKCIYKIK